jgi:filamentous hemagglutinin
VENPNPGQRPGQIHYQEGKEKYLYDTVAKVFKDAALSGHQAA